MKNLTKRHWFLSDHQSKAVLSLINTYLGEYLGTPGIVSNLCTKLSLINIKNLTKRSCL